MFNWLIRRAMRTPYYHLTGYMERFWLVPYRAIIKRQVPDPFAPEGETLTVIDGTGPVSGFRPIARLLQRFDVAVRVHHILRSDSGRDPHDHPWPYLTVILRGGYWEQRYNDSGALVSVRWHGVGSILFRRANSWHKLEVPVGKTAWTLFITGKKAQTWGFRTRDGKVPYYEYEESL